MKLDKYYKLKDELETFSFETNFSNLSNVLYYFSFLGNIFLILFSFFFIKNISSTIPYLFPGQGLFFTLFIIAFMTCYELFKRFSFEQFTSSILKAKKISINLIIGGIVCFSLVCGSFYLSLQGSHRLIDTSDKIVAKMDTLKDNRTADVYNIYKNRISLKEEQLTSIHTNDENGVLNPAQRKVVSELENDIKILEKERDDKISKIEAKIDKQTSSNTSEAKENNFAFAALVFFLEFIILIGVAFNAYYRWFSFVEMKQVLLSPKYKQMELNLNLLKILYQGGRKNEYEHSISINKLKDLASGNKIQCTPKDINEFMTLCTELQIITGNKRGRVYGMSYEKAKSLLEQQEDL